MGDEATKIIVLSDGRSLSCSFLGDDRGHPVIYHHGGLSCSLDITALTDQAKDEQLRIIAIDRPGLRASTRLPGHSVADIGRDTVAVADYLDLDRLSLLGWSAGGPHALAGALSLGSRCQAVVTVGAPAPETGPEVALSLTRRWPQITSLATRLTARVPTPVKDRWIERSLPASDREVINSRELNRWLAGALRQGSGGVVDDFLALGGRWQEGLRGIKAPLRLLHGRKDTIVRPRSGLLLSELLPSSELQLVADEGHFLIHSRFDLIAQALKG